MDLLLLSNGRDAREKSGSIKILLRERKAPCFFFQELYQCYACLQKNKCYFGGEKIHPKVRMIAKCLKLFFILKSAVE